MDFLHNVKFDGEVLIDSLPTSTSFLGLMYNATTKKLEKRTFGTIITKNVGDYMASSTLNLPNIFAQSVINLTPSVTTGTISLASQTQKTFFAAPNALNGTPTFRAMVASDVPTLSLEHVGLNSTSVSNWNTAFGWGNHAGLYAPLSHNHTFASLTEKPTTLVGYGIIDAVTTNTIQTITHRKTFNAGLSIQGFNQFANADQNLAYFGRNLFGYENTESISDSAYAFGDNIFPSMDLQPYNQTTEPWNNKGYLGIGSGIFVDYTGGTNYRPDHNAHDSWIGVGRALGSGFLDGTNITMMGTTNMHRNDVLYGDSVTVIGKGNTNGITANGVALNPNRTVLAESTGLNLRNIMTDVIIIGHENWIEDIYSSVILGSNTRPYGYVFNSVVLGSNNSNWNVVVNPSAPKMNLDSDIIIGVGNWKRTERHNSTHNLLIGMDSTYGLGQAPNFNYRSLIEGDFKYGTMRVNGVVIAGHSKPDSDKPNETDIPLEQPAGKGAPEFDPDENIFYYDGTSQNTSFKIATLVANPNKAIYVKIEAPDHLQGNWGFTFNGSSDSGNVAGYAYRNSVIISTTSDFLLSTTNYFTGSLKITLRETDLNGVGTLPNMILSDSYEINTVEIRGGKSDNRHMMFGLNAGKFLHLGMDTMVFGNDALAKSTFSSTSIIMGNNAAKNMPASNNSVIIGHNSFVNGFSGTGGVTAVGNNIIENPTIRLTSIAAFGSEAFRRLQTGLNNSAFGPSAGAFLLTGNNNLFAGWNTGLIQNGSNNTFLGASAGGYGLLTSTVNNTIVIGSGAVPEAINNTTTIATINNTDNFLYGITHSNSFRVRGGLATQVMMANGTLKDESTFGGGHTHSNLAVLNGITSTNVTNWNTAFTNSHTHANKSFLDGIVNQATVTIKSIGNTVADYGLSSATFGEYGGFVQTASASLTAEIPIDGNWFNKIKILHNNSAGYFTEIASSFIGSEGIWHRRMSGGVRTTWKRVWDNSDFDMNTFISRTANVTITGVKEFTNLAVFNGSGNGYNNGSIMVQGNGESNTVFPNIGFHQPGMYAASILLKNGEFQLSITDGSFSSIRANAFIKAGGSSTQLLRADGSVIEQSSVGLQSLTISQEAEEYGQNLAISGSNSVQISDRFVGSRDGYRDLTGIKPNTYGRKVFFNFANASGITGATGNYAGVMTYAPWDGLTSSTGDSSYQLAFINETGLNGSGNPGLRLRKGIDSTWGSWFDILTSANGVSKFNTESIGGTKTFNNQIIAAGGTGVRYWEGSIRIDGGGTANPFIFPTIGFLHSGMYGATISLQTGEFHFKDDTVFTVLRSGAHYAPAFYESSLRELKKNIKPFNLNGLDLINSLELVTFDRKDELAKNKIGIIADDTKKEFLSEEQDSVDLYKTIFIQAKAIQELDAKNKQLEDRLEKLEKLLNLI